MRLTRGRPPKLTRELEKRLLGILSAGVPKNVACPAVGIADRTLRIWVERANAGEPRYVEFVDKLDEAIAGAKVGLVLSLRGAARKDWRAAAFLLERTDHENFGQRVPRGPNDGQDAVAPQVTILLKNADPVPDNA